MATVANDGRLFSPDGYQRLVFAPGWATDRALGSAQALFNRHRFAVVRLLPCGICNENLALLFVRGIIRRLGCGRDRHGARYRPAEPVVLPPVRRSHGNCLRGIWLRLASNGTSHAVIDRCLELARHLPVGWRSLADRAGPITDYPLAVDPCRVHRSDVA